MVKFLEPKSVKGTGLLRWTKEDGSSDQWFFLPKLKMAKKVKSKEKSKSFMSTDFIYEDLENRNINDDIFQYEGQEIVNGNSCAVISSTPIKDSSYKFFLQVFQAQFHWSQFSTQHLLDLHRGQKYQ